MCVLFLNGLLLLYHHRLCPIGMTQCQRDILEAVRGGQDEVLRDDGGSAVMLVPVAADVDLEAIP